MKSTGPEPSSAKELCRRENLRPACHLALRLSLLAAAYALPFYFPSGISYCVCFLTVGVIQHHLFIVLHEAVHFSLFSNRRINDAVGMLVGSAIGFSLAYRHHHMAHHRELGTEHDPDFRSYADSPLPRARIVFDVLGCLSGVKAILQFFQKTSLFRVPAGRQFADALTIALVQVLLAGVFALLGHPLWYLTLWLLPLITAAKTISFYRSVAEHSLSASSTAAPGNRLRTFRPNLMESLVLAPMNFNFHAEHHFRPNVPYYNLPRLSRTVERDANFARALDKRTSYVGFLWTDVIVPGWKLSGKNLNVTRMRRATRA